METPEKIYLTEDNPLKEWYRTKQVGFNSIEYTRTDAFIEKVARFLKYKLNDRVEIRVAGTLIPSLTSKIAFIDEFRKYMKGE